MPDMAYPYLPGSNTEAFKGLSVLVGLMVSIGGASVVGQALAGLILMYTHTFRIGDYVRVGDCEGTVVAMIVEASTTARIRRLSERRGRSRFTGRLPGRGAPPRAGGR